jgi:GNAT superfamily N-acetyltransferase
LKRLFVRPEARGRRIGERLLAALEERALADGLSVLRLAERKRGQKEKGSCQIFNRNLT